MEIDDLRQKYQILLTYDLWCTQTLLDHFDHHRPFSNEVACRAFLAHIVNMQEIWYCRVVKSAETDTEKWDEFNSEELQQKARANTRKWLDLIGDHDVEFEAEIFFFNDDSVKKSAKISEICHHLTVHGEFHRAQISLFLRNCDIKPPPLNFKDFKSGF
jgi:uncharacterized damage-inducible protein DinB